MMIVGVLNGKGLSLCTFSFDCVIKILFKAQKMLFPALITKNRSEGEI